MDSPIASLAAAPTDTGSSALPGPTVTPTSPEQLMLAYAAGDAEAFDRLYGQYRAPLYRFILRQVGDPVTSNDLYQQCWEKVIKGRHSYRSTSPFPAWLFRIARNTVIDHFRRQAPAAVSTSLFDSAAGSAGMPGETASPEDTALAAETDGLLAAAIDSLPPEQREVVLLRLEAGLDLAAIAEITASKPETCKSRLRYALAKLQECMQESGQQAPKFAGGEHATH